MGLESWNEDPLSRVRPTEELPLFICPIPPGTRTTASVDRSGMSNHAPCPRCRHRCDAHTSEGRCDICDIIRQILYLIYGVNVDTTKVR